MIDVIPGINDKEKEEVEHKITIVSPHVEWIHIDISDNTIVPTETFLKFELLEPVIQASGNSFEAHLMVAHPEKYIRSLVNAGFKRLIAHIECVDPRLFLKEVRYESVEVGLAIDGPSELEQFEPLLDGIDMALVMTIEAGPSGQPFLPETVEKIKTIHQNVPDLPIEVDGGMRPETSKVVRDAGATRIVATTFLFQDPARIAQAIEKLRQ